VNKLLSLVKPALLVLLIAGLIYAWEYVHPFSDKRSDNIGLTSIPSIQLDPNHFEFGDLFCGERVRHRFMIKNLGPGELAFNKITTSCACEVARLTLYDKTSTGTSLSDLSRLPHLRPNDTATLDVELDTSVILPDANSRVVAREVYIYTNDPQNSPAILHLTASMVSPFVFEPTSIDLGHIRKGSLEAARCSFLSAALSTVVLLRPSVQTSSRFVISILGPSLQEKSENAHLQHVIQIALASDVGIGPFSDTIYFDTNSERVPRAALRIAGVVDSRVEFQGNVSSRPEFLDFGVLGKENHSTSLLVHNTDVSRPYFLRSVSVTTRPADVPVTTQIIERVSGVDYTVCLKLGELDSNTRYFDGILSLHSEDDELPEKSVPFRGWVDR